MRKDNLSTGHYYHIFSRSIAKYVVCNNSEEYSRFIELLKMYRYANFNYKYSRFIELDENYQKSIIQSLIKENNLLVEIVAFCLMPTHIHLLLKQVADNGISKYISNVLNSYSRYFNNKHKRTGPLWSGRFKNVLIKDDDQLLHLTRYIHLNPTSAGLTHKVSEWPYSSYLEYIDDKAIKANICSFENLFDFDAKGYKKFVLDHKDYQKEISKIKKIIVDDYIG
ncbi:MAG: hypothetical protein HW405_149 [Candidatus Berkelbacteria bacterium]|nr:hypothetical protein [Candidatus Berkelbacteria bacterium]